MPIPTGEKWQSMPFSFKKASYTVGGLLLLLFSGVTAFRFVGREFSDTEFYLWLFGGWALLLGSWRVVTIVGWRLASSELRSALPYDSSESTRGTIHSWSDLWRWIRS